MIWMLANENLISKVQNSRTLKIVYKEYEKFYDERLF